MRTCCLLAAHVRTADLASSPDQLVLDDDLNFLPELDLLPINLEDTVLVTDVDSLHSSSQLTPQLSQHDGGSGHDLRSAVVMPHSASSFETGGPVGQIRGSVASSLRGDSGAGIRIGSGFFQQDEAQGLLEDDLGMQIDADGNFVLDEDLPAPAVREAKAQTGRANRVDYMSDEVSARVRLEHGGDHQGADFVSVPIRPLDSAS